MFHDHRRRRAIDKRFVLQFVFDRSHFPFQPRNFFVEALALRRFVRLGDCEKKEELAGAWASRGPFDICICELDFDELAQFGDLFALVRPHMRENARIVALHIDQALGHIDAARIIRSGLPLDGHSKILYSGTRVSNLGRHLMKKAVAFADRHRAVGKLVFGAAALVAAALSRASAPAVERQDPYRCSRHSTSLTMIIDLA